MRAYTLICDGVPLDTDTAPTGTDPADHGHDFDTDPLEYMDDAERELMRDPLDLSAW
jgi:hypothetical protein